MELNAYTRTIRTLFSTNVKYIVPRFQREYSWTQNEILELWNDIIFNIIPDEGKFKNLEYFIGSIVLIGEDRSSELQIVDGQQRITTITIILSALVQVFKDIDQNNVAEAIYSTYIEGKDDDNEPFFKLVNENPKPFLQKSIQYIEKEQNEPSNKEEKALWFSYSFFYKKLKLENLSKEYNGWSKVKVNGSSKEKHIALLKGIRDQLVSFLKVIYITVASEDDAYMIFETLNARGKNLSAVDLVKNELFKNLRGTHPDDSAKRKWKNIQSNLSSRDQRVNVETFFRHYWLSKFSFVTESKIYKNYKKLANSGKIDPMVFLTELESESELYNNIANPLLEDWPQQEDKVVYNSLSALSLFQISQVRSFLLSLIIQKNKKMVSHSDFTSFLVALENFHFKYTSICSLRMNVFEGKYSKAARDLRNAKSKIQVKKIIEDLIEYYRSKVPNKTLFVKSFHKLKFTKTYTKDKKIIRYIFNRIEKNYRTTSELDMDLVTLEHLLPQSTSGISNIGKLGNLIPLDKKLNESADNKSFGEKVPIFEKSELVMVDNFLKSNGSNTQWTKQDIENRTDELAEYCYDRIWLLN